MRQTGSSSERRSHLPTCFEKCCVDLQFYIRKKERLTWSGLGAWMPTTLSSKQKAGTCFPEPFYYSVHGTAWLLFLLAVQNCSVHVSNLVWGPTHQINIFNIYSSMWILSNGWADRVTGWRVKALQEVYWGMSGTDNVIYFQVEMYHSCTCV